MFHKEIFQLFTLDVSQHICTVTANVGIQIHNCACTVGEHVCAWLCNSTRKMLWLLTYILRSDSVPKLKEFHMISCNTLALLPLLVAPSSSSFSPYFSSPLQMNCTLIQCFHFNPFTGSENMHSVKREAGVQLGHSFSAKRQCNREGLERGREDGQEGGVVFLFLFGHTAKQAC